MLFQKQTPSAWFSYSQMKGKTIYGLFRSVPFRFIPFCTNSPSWLYNSKNNSKGSDTQEVTFLKMFSFEITELILLISRNISRTEQGKESIFFKSSLRLLNDLN